MSDLRDFTGKNRVFTGTDGERISLGTTSERVDGQGKLRFNTTTNLMEYYTGTDWKSIDAPPVITGFTVDGGADVTTANIDGSASGNATIEVKGSLFDTTGGVVTFVGTSETISTETITRNSANLLTVTVARSSFDNTNEPYSIKVTNGSGLSAELADAISQDRAVTFTNAADTNFDIFDSLRGSVSIAAADLAGATDADGDTITYSITSGSLPSGLSIASSTGIISGSTSAVSSDTVSTFTVQAATTDLNVTRQFTITQKPPQITTYTSGSGNFSVPSGISSIDVLVVAGGGQGGKGIPNNVSVGAGGAGGLIYRPGFTVTPGGTVAYSIGGGGFNPSEAGADGTDTTFGTLTAKGGGGGGHWDGNAGRAGGSGGGGSSGQSGGAGGGPGTQPSQPGDSGTYGFGNSGGSGGPTWNNGNPGGPNTRGGGGGGAGGSGTPGNQNAAGGAGKVYSISGSPVGYAGGGGGGAGQGPGPAQHGGGTGGSPSQDPAPAGTANRGGGGGGGGVIGQTPSTNGGAGGSGVVIISF